MKRLFSSKCSDTAFTFATLILRFGLGGIMMGAHGFDKLQNFATKSENFSDPFGLGSTFSLALVVFAEFFCSFFIIIGLLTRLATIPLIIAMGVALYVAHNGEILGGGEKAGLYLMGYLTLLFTGPGKVSVDRLIGK